LPLPYPSSCARHRWGLLWSSAGAQRSPFCSDLTQPPRRTYRIHCPSFPHSSDSYYDCLIIACMRRLQEWSYVSILAEFRHNTWPHKLPDLEQILEIFHTSAVDLTSCTPEFLAIHDNFKVCCALLRLANNVVAVLGRRCCRSGDRRLFCLLSVWFGNSQLSRRKRTS
jgi:hypothetical protein